MNRFLLINNKKFFDNHNVVTINNVNDIPDKNAILFIGSHVKSIDNPKHILKYFDAISSKQYQYVIIVGKGDGSLKPNINIPKNIRTIYCTNINYTHDKIKFMPMGCDFRSIYSFHKANIKNNNRNILCYCNFSLNTHSIRRKIYRHLRDKTFITFDHMGSFLNYNISRDQFFTNLGNSKFVICPRGAALDTFRFYDTIYSGAIPIVIKTAFHNLPFFNEVPILFLDNEADFKNLTEDFLNKTYDKLIIKKKNYFNLNMNHFISEIKKCLIMGI